MKTKNNVQKTILRSIAVVVSFVLISFTVSAQDFWKKLLENSSFNEIALAMVETSPEKPDSDSKAENLNYAYQENESEPTLEIEDWMLDEELFQVNENVELPLEVEPWMTSEKVWEM